MSTTRENAEEVNVVPEKETTWRCAEQSDFSPINVEQQAGKIMADTTVVKLETAACNSTVQNDENNVSINHKELKNLSSKINQDYEMIKIMKNEETDASVMNDIIHKEENSIVTIEMTDKGNKRVPAKKIKKNNKSDDKENLEKVNSGKVVKAKTLTKRSCKTSKKRTVNKIVQQENEEPLEDYTKVQLYKINPERCFKCNMTPLTSVKPETKMYNTRFLGPSITKQQELNQYSLGNSPNVLQHLDYDNLKNTNQHAMSAANYHQFCIMVPKTNESFVPNRINNMQSETIQSDYINDKQHACVDYNWKSNENSYFNSVVNSAGPSKLLPGNRTHCPCSMYGSNCTWNNLHMQNFPRINATFQQATNNVAPNYAILQPTNTLNNFLSPAVTQSLPFNPFYYHQQLLTDDNFKKLYYRNLDNNHGYDLTMKKENVMSLSDNWHQSNSLTIPSTSNFNVPPATPMWYNTPETSSFLNTSISTTSDANKAQFKSGQNTTYLNHYNHHNIDMTKTSVYKDQWREKDQFASYVKPAVQNTLPPITTILPTSNNTQALESYGANNELMNSLTQNSTETNTDESIVSNIADFPPEAPAVVPVELTTPYLYAKNKKLMSDFLESIL